jgi:PKD repeat protein
MDTRRSAVTYSPGRPRRWIGRLAFVVLFAMPLVVFATRSLLSAAAVGVALLLGGFLVAVAVYLWAALALLESGRHRAARRKTSARARLQSPRRETTVVLLVVIAATTALAVAPGGAQAQPDGTRPPITTPPPATDTQPPAEAIIDSREPITTCGDWSLQSTYGGHWSTDSTWWEYQCGAVSIGNDWIDYYYWDGSQAIFYGQWYAYMWWDNEYFWECYWWDEATSQWYGSFSCSDPNPGLPPNTAPTASFTFRCSGLSCSFDGSGSADSDGRIDYWYWDFGDASSSGGRNTAEHAYAQAGAYTVTLSVTDSRGATATDSKTFTVEGSPPPPNASPTASFTVSCIGLSCSFDGSGSADSDGTIAVYNWSFGDGSSGGGKLVQHTYAQPGTYTPTLTVIDNGGLPATDSKAVTVLRLTAKGYRVSGLEKAALSWNGSSGASFNVYRDGGKIATVAATSYTDNINKTSSGSYTYKVCAVAASTCSNKVTVTF